MWPRCLALTRFTLINILKQNKLIKSGREDKQIMCGIADELVSIISDKAVIASLKTNLH